MRDLGLLIVALVGLLAPAEAWSISMAPNPLPVLDGEIRLVGDGTGLPAGGVVLDGAIGPTDVVLAFEFEQFADPLAVLSDLTFGYPLAGSPVSPAVTAVGTIDGAGEDITGAALSGVVFDPGAANGFTTDVFFVAFASSPVGADWQFGTLGGFLLFNPVVLVPEPSTALLWLFGGACVLAARRRE